MSAGDRLTQLLAPACVGIWILAGLAWNELRAAEPPLVEERSRIELRPEPPQPLARAEPEPAPPAEPKPPAAAPAPREARAPDAEAPAPRHVGGAELDAGQRLLAGGGAFPPLSAGYEDFRSFANYARAMTGLGARFVVIRNRSIVATADLASGRLEPLGEPASLARFSPRARNYTGEPALARLTRAARREYGGGSAIGMLVPRGLDAGLFGGIARALERRGEGPELYREIRGRYEPHARGARFRVETAVRRDGSKQPLLLVFDLQQIVELADRGTEGA